MSDFWWGVLVGPAIWAVTVGPVFMVCAWIYMMRRGWP